MADDVIQLPAPIPTALEVTDDLLALAERRIEKVQKMVTLSLKVTNHQDWVDQQGKPYLMGSGAEKVARLWGVKVHSVASRKIPSSDEKGNFYFYECTGIVELPGAQDSLHAVGTCSSKDQFFAATTVEEIDEDGNKTRVKSLKPFSEIDETNIMKSAYTNFIVNGITRLLGIRNLTFDQLREAGIPVDKIGKVDYRGSNSEMSEGAKSKKEECWQRILGACGGDEKAAKVKLRDLTTWKKKDGETVTGKDDIHRLSEKQIEILYEKVQKLAPAPSTSNGNPDDNMKLDMIAAIQECTTRAQLEPTFKLLSKNIEKLSPAGQKEVGDAYNAKHAELGKGAK